MSNIYYMSKEEKEKAEKLEKEMRYEEDRLIASKMYLKNKYPYLSILISKTRMYVVNEGKTGYTDGKKICIDVNFSKGLSNEELNFLVMHEVLHIFLLHVRRFSFMGNNPIHEVQNIAADYVVNMMIHKFRDEKMKLIEGTLFSWDFEDWTTEEVYNYLRDKVKDVELSILGEDGKDGEGDSGESGEGEIGKDSEGGEEEEGEGTDGDGFSIEVEVVEGHDDRGNVKTKQGHSNGEGMGHEEWGNLSEGDIDKIKEDIAEGVQKGSTSFSLLPSSIKRAILNEIKTQNKRDWRDTLESFIFTAKSNVQGGELTYDDRLLGNGIYYVEEDMLDKPENILFAIDNSGSIGDDELTEFLGNVISCIENLDLGDIDDSGIVVYNSRIVGEWSFRENGKEVGSILDFISNCESGGTDLRLPYEYAENEDRFNGVVNLTDGCGIFPNDFDKPSVVILSYADGEIPEFGDTVYLKGDFKG